MAPEGIPVTDESRCVAVFKPPAAVGVLGLAGALIVGSAHAADLFHGPGSLKDFPTAPPVPRCAIFHGFYVGAHVGDAVHDWTWQDRDAWTFEVSGNDADIHRDSVSATDSGVAGGVQAGFNWQRGCTVFGFEADWSWADLDSTKLHTDGDNDDTLRVRGTVDGFGTLRTRAGVVVDNLLLYVTGGLAFADIERRATFFENFPTVTESFTFSDTRVGLAAGLGAEWALTDHISLKSEALWLRFEDDTGTGICTHGACNPAGEPKRFDLQDDVFTARIGVNFKFGGGP
jgi:outer membrane immunogenic protein